MTLALAIIFVALLMIYAGIKGRSLKHALTGRAAAGGEGQVTG